jgi:hypothetical protein
MAIHIRRREFMFTLGGAAATWPLAARAQQPGMTPRVGYIRAGTPRNDPFREEFVRGMRDLGYVEGRNIAYEFRHCDSSHTAMVGAGKFGSAKLPMATATYPGKPSLCAKLLVSCPSLASL